MRWVNELLSLSLQPEKLTPGTAHSPLCPARLQDPGLDCLVGFDMSSEADSILLGNREQFLAVFLHDSAVNDKRRRGESADVFPDHGQELNCAHSRSKRLMHLPTQVDITLMHTLKKQDM